ncbi:hypothetical protein BC351_01185 [Paenibacillus ferrarius]|uniref:Uncharacterized protein n=1 Tax=Paenibacillus ferrarius TaxID=1469647 RepID=A0A1V4HTI2_9BACL|nr:hypothetical protein [Paenibacillus ferrarius]OPH61885.1 hypothetical protein BC351_01185 [Paenibacillus ferrarius]
MKLKDIFEVEKNDELHKQYTDTYEKLKERYRKTNENGYNFFPKKELIGDYTCESGYARNTYRGRIPEGVELNELELSMICDDGFSHFGGSSSIYKDGTYTVVIYID